MAVRGRTGAGFERQRRLAADDLDALVRRSHALVAGGLTKKLQRELGVLA